MGATIVFSSDGTAVGSGFIPIDGVCSEGDGREEEPGTSIIAGCHTLPIFEPAEHDLNVENETPDEQ